MFDPQCGLDVPGRIITECLPVVLINPRFIRHALGSTALRYLTDIARKAAIKDKFTSGDDKGDPRGRVRRELFRGSSHVYAGQEHSIKEVTFVTDMFVPGHNQLAPVKLRLLAACRRASRDLGQLTDIPAPQH